MKYRVKRQDDLGNVFTVPHDGVWYENLADAIAVKRKLEHPKHKQDYWIEDEEGRVIKIVLGNCLLQRAEEKEVGLKGQQF
jgi:hypothetical protein